MKDSDILLEQPEFLWKNSHEKITGDPDRLPKLYPSLSDNGDAATLWRKVSVK